MKLIKPLIKTKIPLYVLIAFLFQIAVYGKFVSAWQDVQLIAYEQATKLPSLSDYPDANDKMIKIIEREIEVKTELLDSDEYKLLSSQPALSKQFFLTTEKDTLEFEQAKMAYMKASIRLTGEKSGSDVGKNLSMMDNLQTQIESEIKDVWASFRMKLNPLFALTFGVFWYALGRFVDVVLLSIRAKASKA